MKTLSQASIDILSPVALKHGFELQSDGKIEELLKNGLVVISIDSPARRYEFEIYINAYISGYRSCNVMLQYQGERNYA